MLEAETATSSSPGQARGLPDRLRNWSGRMGGSLTAMVDNLTKGTCCRPDLHSHHALLCCAALQCNALAFFAVASCCQARQLTLQQLLLCCSTYVCCVCCAAMVRLETRQAGCAVV